MGRLFGRALPLKPHAGNRRPGSMRIGPSLRRGSKPSRFTTAVRGPHAGRRVCWRTAACAVGMDAVNGEAVLAAWQNANQARCSAHPPSRPWRVGRALQEQGQPYSTLQREYLPRLTGEPPLPHNAHYRQPHRCVHGSRQLALRLTARLCGGCAAAPCRAPNGRRQWPVECSQRSSESVDAAALGRCCVCVCVPLCRSYAMA